MICVGLHNDEKKRKTHLKVVIYTISTIILCSLVDKKTVSITLSVKYKHILILTNIWFFFSSYQNYDQTSNAL